MQNFHIGAERWAGLSKLIEEAGEVLQIAGKLMGTRGLVKHWDGTDLRLRLEEEVADLLAALQFFIDQNYDSAAQTRIRDRAVRKCKRFREWHEHGDPIADPSEPTP